MNRTPNTTEKTNAQPVFNYAQAAKRSSQNLESQKPKTTPAPSTNESKPTAESAAKVESAPASFAAALSKKTETGKNIPSKPSNNNNNNNRTTPREPSTEAAPIQFGTVKADEAKPVETEATNVTENNSRRDSTQLNNAEPHYYNNNRHYGSRQGKHNNHSPNMQPSYVPHHVKKNMSPNQNSGNWSNNQYYRPSQYYPPNTFMPVPPYTGQTFVPQPSVNKAIAIINPTTNEVINLSSQPPKETPAATTKPEESSVKETKDFKIVPTPSRAIKIVDPRAKEEEAEKKAKEEAEQKAKKEAEQKAKEEAEKKAKEEAEQKVKEEAEQKAKEEAEKKAKEEAEQKAKEEAEKKAKEEAEQKAKEEAEQKAKEEAEQKAKEEAEQKAKEEAEKKAKEEAEQKAKEEAEQKAKEEEAENKTKEEEEEAKKAATEESKSDSTEKKVEERIAAITADKAARGAPGRLDMSAIPAHVFHDSPVSTPSSPSAPKVKGPPMRKIEDFSAIEYPPEFLAPKPSANNKITYEPAFLLQFQKLCLETDEDLSEFQGMAAEQSSGNERRSMSRRQTSERGGRGPRTPGGGSGEGGMYRGNSRDGRGEMGKFAGGRPLSHRQGSNGPNSPGMDRQDSRGGRNRSSRGGKGRHPPREQQGGPTIPLDQVAPLEKSENRWVPTVVATDGAASTASERKESAESDLISQDIIARKIKALLNKLTLEKFDSISNQIWEFAKQSEKEDNGLSLRNVIQLIFDKACDEPNFASMWAQLCKKLYDLTAKDTNIKDVNILDKNGAIVSGGPLYRKYLLNRCQQEFEKGWKTDLPKVDDNNPDVMMTDEYYAAVKAKRQGLGLVQFIGELFKLQMLTERVMIQCLMKLCADPKHPEDEETETMCKMLMTIGKTFDASGRKNKEWLDAYFQRMQEMYESSTLSSRVKFMILDVFDHRKSKWTLKRGGNQPAPTTISQIHEQAKKASEEKEKETIKRSGSSRGGGNPMSRQSSHRSGGRDIMRQNSSRNANKEDQSGSNSPGAAATSADGWNTVGPGSPTTAPRLGRTNELANFGKTDRSKSRNSGVLGPSSSPFFNNLSRSNSKSGVDKKTASNDTRSSSPATSMSNMFSALGGEGQEEETAERKKLQLLPRSSENAEEAEKSEEALSATTAPKEEESSSPSEVEKPKLSDEVIERRCKGTIDEYFSLRDKAELCECVKELDHTHYRVVFASKLLDVVEKKTEDVEIVCEMIEVLNKEKLMAREEYVAAFKKFWEGYEDLVIDVPKAPEHVNKLLAATGIERSEVECEPSY